MRSDCEGGVWVQSSSLLERISAKHLVDAAQSTGQLTLTYILLMYPVDDRLYSTGKCMTEFYDLHTNLSHQGTIKLWQQAYYWCCVHQSLIEISCMQVSKRTNFDIGWCLADCIFRLITQKIGCNFIGCFICFFTIFHHIERTYQM